MKILVVDLEFPPYVPSGGGAAMLMNEATSLLEAGNEVTVIAGRAAKTEVETVNGLTVVRVPFPDIPPRSLWFQIFGSKTILRYAVNSNVVYCYGNSISLLLWWLHRMGVPVVAKIRGLNLNNMRAYCRLPVREINFREVVAHFILGPIYVLLTFLDLRYSAELVFDSGFALLSAESFYRTHIRHKSAIVHNAVDVERRKSPASQRGRQVVFVGRLIALKGILDLLSAFAAVIEDHEFADWKLVVVGDGPLRHRLQQIVLKRCLWNNVRLLGNMPNPLVLEIERASHALVHPSYIESNSVTIAEAMALELPVVIPFEPWAIEQTREYSNRFFFKLGDVKGLGDAMKHVMKAPLRRAVWNKRNAENISLWSVIKAAAHPETNNSVSTRQ